MILLSGKYGTFPLEVKTNFVCDIVTTKLEKLICVRPVLSSDILPVNDHAVINILNLNYYTALLQIIAGYQLSPPENKTFVFH